MTPDILLARIEATERAILNGWDSDGKARIASMWTGGEPGYTTVAADHGDGAWVADGREVMDARHVQVLFDPARVLAVCAGAKTLVELHAEIGGECGTCEGPRYPCRTLAAVAAMFAEPGEES